MQEHPGGEIPMRQPQFIRSNTFHWALMVAGVFAVFVIALFGFIYWQIDDYLTARSDRVITLEIEGISSLSPERRLQAIDEKLRQDPRGVQLAAIFAADGHRITGNIEGLPAGLRIDAAAQAADIVKINGNGPEHQIIRAIARHMRNGDVLVLGRNVDEAREISHVVGQALGLGLLPAFLLCLLAGAWLSVRAQKRVEEVNQRVQRIIAGDLRERLPHRNIDEPFSKLAGIVNGKITYLPKTGFHGTDTFMYQITDGFGLSAIAKVTVTVNSGVGVGADWHADTSKESVRTPPSAVLTAAMFICIVLSDCSRVPIAAKD